LDNADTYLQKDNYFSAINMMNGIGSYFQKYRKGDCTNVLVKFFKAMWNAIKSFFSIIEKLCLAV